MTTITKNLKLIRLIAKLTQTEFAEIFQVTKSIISNYEKGKTAPDELFISRLSRFSGIDEDTLTNVVLKEENLQELQKGQKAQLFIAPPPYVPPAPDLMEESVQIQLLIAEFAKLKAHLFPGLSVETIIDEFEKNAKLAVHQARKSLKARWRNHNHNGAEVK